MKLLLSSALLFLVAQVSFAQSFRLQGTVYSAQDSVPVPFAKIINETRNEGVLADVDGTFSLKVFPGNQIRISAIGFEKTAIIASETGMPLSVYLTTSVEPIDTVVVYPLPPKELFKQAFMDLELTDDNPINLNIPEDVMALRLPDDPGEKRVAAPNELPSAGGIPIHGGPSKLQKQEAALYGKKKEESELDRKYGDDLISNLTGLQDAGKIAALRKFCNLSKEFILNNKEYDIAVAIVNCYKEFEKEGN